MRSCRTCGSSLEGRTPRAQFCDSGCRTRYARGHRPAVVVEFVPKAEPDAEPVEDDDEGPTLEEIAAELRRTLRSANTPASAKAGLARELRATMDAIAASKPKPKDAVDELFERRAARGGA